jgi:hypothetical protein
VLKIYLTGGVHRFVCVCVCCYVKFTGFTSVQSVPIARTLNNNSAYMSPHDCKMTVWTTVLLSVLCALALDMYHLKLINPHFSVKGTEKICEAHL